MVKLLGKVPRGMLSECGTYGLLVGWNLMISGWWRPSLGDGHHPLTSSSLPLGGSLNTSPAQNSRYLHCSNIRTKKGWGTIRCSAQWASLQPLTTFFKAYPLLCIESFCLPGTTVSKSESIMRSLVQIGKSEVNSTIYFRVFMSLYIGLVKLVFLVRLVELVRLGWLS